MLYFAVATIVTVDAVGLSPVFGYSLGLHTECETVTIPEGAEDEKIQKAEKIQADPLGDTKMPESNTSAVTQVPERPKPVPTDVSKDDNEIPLPENKIDRKPATILVACDACGGHGFICYGEHVQGLFVPEYIESCHGTGIIPCPYTICHGGMATCTICNGSGTEVCHGCNGTGIESHHGGGYVYDANGNTSTCHYCNGSGRMTCQYCGGRGSSVCEKCGGTGFAPCQAPHVTCEKCNGTGLTEEKVSATENEF